MTLAAATSRSRKPTPAGNTRVTGKEQFYTPAALAIELVAELESVIGPLKGRTVIEPAGGTGAFIQAAIAAGAADVISVDIEPKHPAVKRADFLATGDERIAGLTDAVTLGNPPFGRNNSLSIPFFNRAADHSEFIAFIVPRSWRKWSVSNRLDLRFRLIHDRDLAVDYVDESGERIWAKNRLATSFQIWQRVPANPRKRVRVTDNGFVVKTSPADADIALTIFGFGCGTVHTDFERVPNTTRMFLKFGPTSVGREAATLAALKSADFERFYRNTAYTEALSLQEINYLLNEALMGNPGLTEID